MAVITISRTLGSGGDEIALMLSRALGYRLFDKRLILRAAQEAGLSGKEIGDLSEDTYQVRGLLDRMFGNSAFIPSTGMWPEDIVALYALQNQSVEQDELLSLVETAVQWAYEADRTVIVGRGSQVLLHDKADVLHIRLDAPLEIRIQRVVEQLSFDGSEDNQAAYHPRAQARDMIHQRDSGSAAFVRELYHANWADPLLYHAVFNTGALSPQQVVAGITALVAALPQVVRQYQVIST